MISLICRKYGIRNYTINDDGSIDVIGDVFIGSIKELPLIFNDVSGDFDCSGSELTTLKGCPRWIGGSFNCDFNNLTSLEFSPNYVGGWFSCEYNDLTDNYCETEIGGNFYTNLEQGGLIINSDNKATNYNEWRKLYKRKQTLNYLFNI
jgi:hypothetical protein